MSDNPAQHADYVAPEQAVGAAEHGLRWTAERLGLNVWSYDTRVIAENVLHHALRSSFVVTYDVMVRRIEDEKAKTERWKRSWAAAEAERDRALCRIQAALSESGRQRACYSAR